MNFLNPVHIALILIGIATYILYIKWVRSKYPPGPLPLPIIGNLHLLSKKPYTELTNMAIRYGSVITIWRAWQPTIIVSAPHLMKEGLVNKGYDFAGRGAEAVKIIFKENEDLGFRRYDDKFLIMRKLSVSIMKSKAIGGVSIQKIVEEEMQHLLTNLKNTNGKVVNPYIYIHLSTFSVLMRAVFNIRFKNEADPEFLKWMEAFVSLEYAKKKVTLTTIAPILGYVIPGIQSKIRSQVRLFHDYLDRHVEIHEKTYKEGIIRDFTDAIIQYQRSQSKETAECQKLTRANIHGLVQNMLGSGSETVIAAFQWAFLVLLYRRDVQEKIHLELDKYFDQKQKDSFKDRSTINEPEDHNSFPILVTLADKPNLPYLNAFIHETLRLYAPGPIFPRRTIVDTSIGKYSIPKNSDVFFNVYACHRDSAAWQKPLDFIPERFLDANGLFNYNKAKQLVTFGAGRRSCVGENIAKMDLFLGLTKVLHTFELCCRSIDELPPLGDGKLGLEWSPYQYKMMFKIRQVP